MVEVAAESKQNKHINSFASALRDKFPACGFTNFACKQLPLWGRNVRLRPLAELSEFLGNHTNSFHQN